MFLQKETEELKSMVLEKATRKFIALESTPSRVSVEESETGNVHMLIDYYILLYINCDL